MIPAKVAGTWQTTDGELKLEQKYQMISGSLQIGAVNAPVQGKVIGNDIVLTAGRTIFTGKVNDGTIEGTATDSGKETKWSLKMKK
jgi:hypothetical protein